MFYSNGIPDHKTGIFPNKGNPNSISQQKYMFVFQDFPKSTASTKIKGIIGIALNGVLFRPATAGFGIQKLQEDIVVMGTKIGVWIFLVLRVG